MIFQDVDDIKPGIDFLKEIFSSITTAKVALVIIGPLWLVNAQERRRIDNPKDVLRNEIEEALKRKLAVIPVLVGGARMPSERDLPESLKPFSTWNAIELSDGRWNYDVGQLIKRLSEIIYPKEGGSSLRLVKQELNHKQRHYFELLPKSATDALEFTQETLAYLDQVSPLYPDDPTLQLVRGYFHKNEAMALRNLGRHEEFNQA